MKGRRYCAETVVYPNAHQGGVTGLPGQARNRRRSIHQASPGRPLWVFHPRRIPALTPQAQLSNVAIRRLPRLGPMEGV
jgi:hypothetical protein